MAYAKRQPAKVMLAAVVLVMLAALLPVTAASAQDAGRAEDATSAEQSGVPDFGSRDFNLDFSVGSDFRPSGLWSDNTTMWVTDQWTDDLGAFWISASPTTYGQRDSDKDIVTNPDDVNLEPLQIWSDGTTIWATHLYTDGSATAVAFNLSDGSRSSDSDIELIAKGTLSFSLWTPRGLWSDGTTLYVVDGTNFEVKAYELSSGDRDSSKDFSLHSDNITPKGAHSDGTTLWVPDRDDHKVYAYTLSSGDRDTSREFNLAPASDEPSDVWSDGTTMWVADFDDETVYAYSVAAGAHTGGL